jgi:hypothetical protein
MQLASCLIQFGEMLAYLIFVLLDEFIHGSIMLALGLFFFNLHFMD